MKFDRIVLQVNVRRLFRFNVTFLRCRPWRHFTQKSAAPGEWMWGVCSSVHQFL